MTVSEAVRELLAGRLRRLERLDGTVEDVVPDPVRATDTGDWGPPYLDPPFPVPPLSGEVIQAREGRLTPFAPITVDDSDLAPE